MPRDVDGESAAAFKLLQCATDRTVVRLLVFFLLGFQLHPKSVVPLFILALGNLGHNYGWLRLRSRHENGSRSYLYYFLLFSYFWPFDNRNFPTCTLTIFSTTQRPDLLSAGRRLTRLKEHHCSYYKMYLNMSSLEKSLHQLKKVGVSIN